MRSLIYNIYKILLLPHLLVYKTSKNKNDIDKDILRWAESKNRKGRLTALLLDFLTHSPDFRSIFYYS